jgi:hypothetical protein
MEASREFDFGGDYTASVGLAGRPRFYPQPTRFLSIVPDVSTALDLDDLFIRVNVTEVSKFGSSGAITQ